MKRTQIRLDDATYETLRRRAFKQGWSMASLVRESLAATLAAPPAGRRWTIKDFTFVGMGIAGAAIGRTGVGRARPVVRRGCRPALGGAAGCGQPL